MSVAWRPPDPPSARSYWAAPDLLGGVYPGDVDPIVAAGNIVALVQAGVTLFVDLTDHRDGLAPYEIHLARAARTRRLSLPVRDLTPPPPDVIDHALQAVDRELQTGGTVYVHCWGGKGRTGTVLGCYLARELGGAEALRTLNARRDAQVTHPRDVGVRRSPRRPVNGRWSSPGRSPIPADRKEDECSYLLVSGRAHRW